MCWPEADKHYDKFLKSYETFRRDLTNILIIDQDRKTKYIKLHDEDQNGKHVFVYLQRKTQYIVKVVINYSTDGKEYGTPVVTIFAEDAEIQDKLANLSYISEMTEGIEECREIMYADQIIGKLTYG